MEIPCTNKIKFITACSFSNDTFEDIMKAQVSVFKASATLNIQAFKIKKSVSISFRMTQVHKTEKDHMMIIRDYDWMMISKKLKDHIRVKIMPKSLKGVDDFGVQKNQEFDTGNSDEQLEDEVAPKNDWFKKPERPLTPDPDWYKRHVRIMKKTRSPRVMSSIG
ncbi:hypothetical protein Tco_0559484 [Tanacetum coccineum]